MRQTSTYNNISVSDKNKRYSNHFVSFKQLKNGKDFRFLFDEGVHTVDYIVSSADVVKVKCMKRKTPHDGNMKTYFRHIYYLIPDEFIRAVGR